MTPTEIALMSAQAVVAQLEAMVCAERAGNEDREVPDGTTLSCPGCGSVTVEQLPRNFDEEWRIRCRACDKVYREPIVETPTEGPH